ncbi:hypothetical protein KCU67_g53, partial [Aureobasidium melanogenum]
MTTFAYLAVVQALGPLLSACFWSSFSTCSFVASSTSADALLVVSISLAPLRNMGTHSSAWALATFSASLSILK